MSAESPLCCPPRSALLSEARTALTLLEMLPVLWGKRRAPGPAVPERHVVVLPGYGTGDLAMLPLRRFLEGCGLSVEGWGQGVNRAGLDLPHGLGDVSAGWGLSPKTPYRGEAGVALLCDRTGEHVARRARALGRPVSLVGWSLGGMIAREVARDLPEAVDRVVTLGSPVIGGPKYTAAAALLRARGLDLDWIETHVAQREQRPIRQPITSIVNRADAVVGWAAAQDSRSPRVRHVEVNTPHTAMPFAPAVWELVLGALTSPDDGR